jgi:long-chain acyl-CoA synthetase
MLFHQLLLNAALRRPDQTAWHWVDRDRAQTYAEALQAMDRMAGVLTELGVHKGDRVTIFAHNGLDHLVAMFGAWRIAAISALVNVKFADELPYYFADHEPSVVVYTHDMAEPVRQAAAVTPSIRHLLCMDGPQDGAISLPEMMAADLKPAADPWDEDAIAHLSYTSGTTGKPKGACLRHEPTVRATRCIAERLRIRNDDVSFGPTALSSSYQLVANLLPPLGRMATLHVMGRWTQATGFNAIEAAGATLFVANPTLLQEVLAEARVRGKKPGRLRLGLSGGGPVPPTLKRAYRDELALPLVESFGQSELGGFMALGFPDLELDDQRLVRVGPPLPDKEVRIVDSEDRQAPPDEVGEIILRGGFMAGYWGKPEKTAEATRGGWLRTGDLGMMDRDGYLTMRGRRSELIRVNGVAWYPRDVEEALCRIAQVSQAALVGIPDPALGSRPIAVVTLEKPMEVDEAAIKAAIGAVLPYDLSPLTLKVVVAFPMTPTGKIAKSDLAASLVGAV